jgi:hypothetical protein
MYHYPETENCTNIYKKCENFMKILQIFKTVLLIIHSFWIHTYAFLAHPVKTIFTPTFIGTWEINTEMLAAMLFIFTLIDILACQTIVHEMVSREAGAYEVTRYDFTQLGTAAIANMT